MMFLSNIQIPPTLYVVIAVAIIVVGVLVFVRDVKKPSNIFFLLAALSVGLWGISFATHIVGYALVAPKSFNDVLTYFIGANTPIMLVLFAMTFARHRIRVSNKALVYILLPYTLLVCSLFLAPSYILSIDVGDGLASGSLYPIYVGYIVTYTLVFFLLLLNRYKSSAGVFRTVLRSVIYNVGASIVAVSVVSAMYILEEKNDYFVFVGYTTLLVMFLHLGIKKLQYHRWSLKPFFTELFVLFIAIILVAQMFLDSFSRNILIDIIVLVFFLVSGYFLIKSVSNETKTKNEIEKLVRNLTDVNEELQVLDKRKSEFVKISAHHLKTPLTLIKGYASMLLEGSFGKGLNEEVGDAIQNIFNASERLVNIIADFMDISNIESGKMEYVFEEVDLKKLVEGVLKEMQLTIQTSGLEVSFNTDEIDGYIINADSGKLRQVISNLVDNAIKYTPKGKVHLFLDKDEKNKKLRLTITDTGVGMSGETINKLFEKFSRAEDANKINTKGSGLGLYVAKEIMKKHDARVWVESRGVGKGSIFHLEFDFK